MSTGPRKRGRLSINERNVNFGFDRNQDQVVVGLNVMQRRSPPCGKAVIRFSVR